MDDMFFQCMSLTNLDLTGFNTSNVTNMGNMFNYCSGLVKIYVGDGWNVDNVGDTFNMFYGCNNILGMLGTTYDGDHVDGTYAHIDGGPDNPGYLSRIVPGDVNLDGTVGIGDIVAITNVMAGIEKNKGVVVRANVNGDESVGIGDIVAITNIMAGKE
jgi:surface protein